MTSTPTQDREILMFTCLLRTETHMGPDGTRLEQNAQARL